MARDKGTKDGFCKSLDWGIPIRWFDLTGIHDLDEERRVKIKLATHGVQGSYPGFLVTILDKRVGEIDSKYFEFDDYLDQALSARTDGREDYPHGRNCRCYEVSASWRFYIATPRATRPFCEAVEAYVESFR